MVIQRCNHSLSYKETASKKIKSCKCANSSSSFITLERDLENYQVMPIKQWKYIHSCKKKKTQNLKIVTIMLNWRKLFDLKTG